MTTKSGNILVRSTELMAVDNQDYKGRQSAFLALGEFKGQRLVDLVLVSATIALLSPIILLRALLSLVLTGHVLENQEPGHDFVDSSTPAPPVRFRGGLAGAGLAGLFSVLNGSYTLVASSLNCNRPGLFSEIGLRKNLGLEYLEQKNCKTRQLRWNLAAYFRTLAKSLLASFASPVSTIDGSEDFHLFGIRIINTTMPQLLDECEKILASRNQVSIGFVNANCMNKCFTDDEYHQILRDMGRVYPDGIGVRLAAQMFGNGVKDNINGTDLFPLLCERLAGTSHGIYLLGARRGVAASTAEKMQNRYPGLKIAGCQHGYFTAQEEADVIDEINCSGADVLMVAMGAPRQEEWIASNRHRLNPRILMGVGGLFDFYSGQISRAPVWLREVGLEWTWRLLQEPGRMWRRYVIGNPLFLYRVWQQKKRNGAIAHGMNTTPAEEAQLLSHFNNLGRINSFHSRVIQARHTCWKWQRTSSVILKRMFDVAAGTVLLITLLPIFFLVIPLIRLESSGPAFYSQMRVGFRGGMFKLWKFRSMYQDAEAQRKTLEQDNEVKGGILFKMKRDPRITRVGRIIRKTSIDELPQLWNVIKGDMSLVGPRPALASEVEQYSIEERIRLLAKPGLTCIWQVKGRSDIPFPQQVLLDEDYLYRQSMFTDIKLLFQTIPAVIRGKGAY